MYCIELSFCDIVVTFRRPCSPLAPHSGRAPGELCPLAPLVMPLIKVVLRSACIENGKLKIIKIRSGCQYVRIFITAAKTYNGPHKTFDWAAGWT